MNTYQHNAINLNYQRLQHEFDAEPINLPQAWLSVWGAFGIWLLSHSQFGLDKFSAAEHRALLADVVALATQPHAGPDQWSSLAIRTRRMLQNALADSSLDEECTQTLCAVHAYVMAAVTGKNRFALLACEAAVVARANGWAAYARGFSAGKIYLKVLHETVAAQTAEFKHLLDCAPIAAIQKCAA